MQNTILRLKIQEILVNIKFNEIRFKLGQELTSILIQYEG